MDSVTHIVVGACIGELALPKQLGKHRLWIGALANSLPDIDVVGSLWLSPTEDLLFHRSITHSLLFAVVVAVLFSLLFKKKVERYTLSASHLFFFLLFQFCLHEALDTCNAYGTGLLEPFSHQRFSIHLLYVADPLFTLMPLVAFNVLCVAKGNKETIRKRIAVLALVIPSVYLLCITIGKQSVVKEVENNLQQKHISNDKTILTPSTFNSLLWYVIAPTDSGYYIGYRSLFDSKHYTMPVAFYPKQDSLLQSVIQQPDVVNLIDFAKDDYTVEEEKGALSFNVIRFGQIFGWRSSQQAPFAFHYYLDSTADNTLVVQRGRFSGWNKETVEAMLHRIKGYQ